MPVDLPPVRTEVGMEDKIWMFILGFGVCDLLWRYKWSKED